MKLITRTFTGFNIALMNVATGETSAVYIRETVANKKRAIAKALKNYGHEYGVVSAEYIEELRAITEENFYANSQPYERPASQKGKV